MRPELPAGTVTFVFTDIEGSTQLLHELGAEAYAEALAEHRRVVRTAFGRHGGVEVDTQGDAFFIAFPTAPGALAAARDAQRGLASGPIRVRMGVHTGTPIVTAEGYVGVDVHRGARIAAVAHGAQVLVSETTRALIADDGLSDLGEHRLKDLSAPQRLFQLGSDEFPPVRSLHRTNLPVPATPFLGRDRELEQVSRVLERPDVRLLTLTGTGGTGKTRLALQAGAEASERYPDGIWWVPLAPIADAALVPEAITGALGGGGDAAGEIGDKQLLLLLDNFEHVVSAAGEVAGLIAACPRLDVLVTSRERLGVAGEHELETPPLERADSVALFLERARALRPDFTANGEVSTICARLDDLPLAVELAAARAKVFSPSQLLERLATRLDLLKAARGADPRQQTLRATIDWSYDLLGQEEQLLFARLSVFAGGCTLESAEEICDADLDVLESLVDKSLVRARADGPGTRFWMLETIREFARERLEESGEAEAWRRRHAEAFEALVVEADVAPYGAGRTQLTEAAEADLHNVRAAIDWASAAGDGAIVLRIFFAARNMLGRGSSSEIRREIEAGLANAPDDDVLRSGALSLVAFAAYRQGDFEAARRYGDEAILRARRAGDDRMAGFCLNALAAVDVAEGLIAEARAGYAESRRCFARTDDVRALAVNAANLADLEIQAGNYSEAARFAAEALESFDQVGDLDGVLTAVVNQATAHLLAGDPAAALPAVRRALGLAAELDDAYGTGAALLMSADLAGQQGALERAATLIGAALHACEVGGAVVEPTEALVLERARAALVSGDLAELMEAEARGTRLDLGDAVAFALDG